MKLVTNSDTTRRGRGRPKKVGGKRKEPESPLGGERRYDPVKSKFPIEDINTLIELVTVVGEKPRRVLMFKPFTGKYSERQLYDKIRSLNRLGYIKQKPTQEEIKKAREKFKIPEDFDFGDKKMRPKGYKNLLPGANSELSEDDDEEEDNEENEFEDESFDEDEDEDDLGSEAGAACDEETDDSDIDSLDLSYPKRAKVDSHNVSHQNQDKSSNSLLSSPTSSTSSLANPTIQKNKNIQTKSMFSDSTYPSILQISPNASYKQANSQKPKFHIPLSESFGASSSSSSSFSFLSNHSNQFQSLITPNTQSFFKFETQKTLFIYNPFIDPNVYKDMTITFENDLLTVIIKEPNIFNFIKKENDKIEEVSEDVEFRIDFPHPGKSYGPPRRINKLPNGPGLGFIFEKIKQGNLEFLDLSTI